MNIFDYLIERVEAKLDLYYDVLKTIIKVSAKVS
jgi:hypothetical protein